MKKLMIAVMAVVFASSLAFAGDGGPKKFDKEAMKEKMQARKEGMQKQREEMKKERKDLQDLVEKYNKEKDAKKKAAIETQIKTKVGEGYDKQLGKMDERLNESRQRISKMEQKLNESRTPEVRAKRVDEITKKLIAGEKMPFFDAKDGKGGKGKGKGREGRGGFNKFDKAPGTPQAK